jgi:ABC-2 type transport system permease protein
VTARGLFGTAARVLRQLRGDHRTIALMLVVPCVMHRPAGLDLTDRHSMVFDRIGPALLGDLPVHGDVRRDQHQRRLRERTDGTLERLHHDPAAQAPTSSAAMRWPSR